MQDVPLQMTFGSTNCRRLQVHCDLFTPLLHCAQKRLAYFRGWCRGNVDGIQVGLKRCIGSPLRYLVARAENNLALNAFDCSVCQQSVFPEDANPNQLLPAFEEASTLKPSSWHCSSSAHRKRRYRCGCYHNRLLPVSESPLGTPAFV